MLGVVVLLPLFVKSMVLGVPDCKMQDTVYKKGVTPSTLEAVSYTHLRAHETLS
jgi:hypothetical protein